MVYTAKVNPRGPNREVTWELVDFDLKELEADGKELLARIKLLRKDIQKLKAKEQK